MFALKVLMMVVPIQMTGELASGVDESQVCVAPSVEEQTVCPADPIVTWGLEREEVASSGIVSDSTPSSATKSADPYPPPAVSCCRVAGICRRSSGDCPPGSEPVSCPCLEPM